MAERLTDSVVAHAEDAARIKVRQLVTRARLAEFAADRCSRDDLPGERSLRTTAIHATRDAIRLAHSVAR